MGISAITFTGYVRFLNVFRISQQALREKFIKG